MRVLSWIVGVPVAVIAVAFAVANRHPVRIELWPLPFAVDAPLYLMVLGSLVVGLVIGALAAWLGGRHWRSLARSNRRQVASLERELETLRKPADGGEGGRQLAAAEQSTQTR